VRRRLVLLVLIVALVLLVLPGQAIAFDPQPEPPGINRDIWQPPPVVDWFRPAARTAGQGTVCLEMDGPQHAAPSARVHTHSAGQLPGELALLESSIDVEQPEQVRREESNKARHMQGFLMGPAGLEPATGRL